MGTKREEAGRLDDDEEGNRLGLSFDFQFLQVNYVRYLQSEGSVFCSTFPVSYLNLFVCLL